MPYTPVNKFLTATEDVRLQHRCSTIAMDLLRTTHFDKPEIIQLIGLHYMMTVKKNRTMDKLCFIEFMETYLGFRNIDAIEKIHELRCKSNKVSLTEYEFVEVLSLLLKGLFADVIKFCFDVYLEMLRMSTYIRRDDVLLMARRNSLKFCKLENSDEFNTNFVTFIMDKMDKDRDDRISYEDYRTSVYEDVTRLQFLGQILPTCSEIESFTKLFSSRPYIWNLELAYVMQQENREKLMKNNIDNKKMSILQSDQPSLQSKASNMSFDTSLSDDTKSIHNVNNPIQANKNIKSLLGR